MIDMSCFMRHVDGLFGEALDMPKIFSSQEKASKSRRDQRDALALEANWNGGATVQATVPRWLTLVPCHGRPYDLTQKAQASDWSPWWKHPPPRQTFQDERSTDSSKHMGHGLWPTCLTLRWCPLGWRTFPRGHHGWLNRPMRAVASGGASWELLSRLLIGKGGLGDQNLEGALACCCSGRCRCQSLAGLLLGCLGAKPS